MRILYLHQYFNTPEMSGGTRSYEMARRLAAHGHEVHMITSDARALGTPTESWTTSQIEGFTVHWASVPYQNSMSYHERMRAFITFAWRAAQRASHIGGDLVFASSTPLTIALPAVYAARKTRAPMVLEIRDVWPEVPIALGALRGPVSRYAARRLERWAYRNAAHVVALAPGMGAAVERTGYPRDKITIIPNGCDLDLFGVDMEDRVRALRENHDWLGGRPLVLYTGTIGLVNRVDYLARLSAKIRILDPEIRTVVIGEGREEARVRETAQELGVLDKTFFMLPAMPKVNLSSWVAASDMMAVLACGPPVVIRDSVQNKFFDAMAAGKPTFHNFAGWSGEIAEVAGAGITLDAVNIHAAARKLVEHLHDKDWMSAASAAAYDLATNRFSRDMLSDRLEGVFLRVLEETSR